MMWPVGVNGALVVVLPAAVTATVTLVPARLVGVMTTVLPAGGTTTSAVWLLSIGSAISIGEPATTVMVALLPGCTVAWVASVAVSIGAPAVVLKTCVPCSVALKV